MDDDAIRDLVTRLSRPHPSGGRVVERAAILAAGAGSADVIEWVIGHAGQGETAAAGRGGGLHGGQRAWQHPERRPGAALHPARGRARLTR